jgi:hypothetical protein
MSKIVSKNNKRYVTLNEAKGLGWVDLMAEILRLFYSLRGCEKISNWDNKR